MYTTYGFGDFQTWGGNQPLEDSPLVAEARDHLLACPADWQVWLASVSTARMGAAFDTAALREEDLDSACADTLLAVLFSGTRAQADAARYELQRRFLRDSAERLLEIEQQLWAYHEADREPEFYDDY